MNLSPAQAAAALAISVQTLRRWSGAFAAALSASATPPPGHQRSYTPRDIALLRHAREMLDAGASIADVAATLPTIPTGDDPAAGDAAPPMVVETPAAALVSALTLIADQKADIERLHGDIDALSKRLQALEEAMQRSQAPVSLLARLFGRRS